MSLLRRRMMMQNQKQNEEHILYIYNGFLTQTGHVNDEPTYNSIFPEAYCTSKILVDFKDTVIVESYGDTTSDTERIRKYAEDGTYLKTYTKWNCVIDASGYIRIMSLLRKRNITSVAIVKEDGRKTNYKIIDLR